MIAFALSHRVAATCQVSDRPGSVSGLSANQSRHVLWRKRRIELPTKACSTRTASTSEPKAHSNCRRGGSESSSRRGGAPIATEAARSRDPQRARREFRRSYLAAFTPYCKSCSWSRRAKEGPFRAPPRSQIMDRASPKSVLSLPSIMDPSPSGSTMLRKRRPCPGSDLARCSPCSAFPSPQGPGNGIGNRRASRSPGSVERSR